jgi:hypothetical protein
MDELAKKYKKQTTAERNKSSEQCGQSLEGDKNAAVEGLPQS